MERIQVLGVTISLLTMQETLQWIEDAIHQGEPRQLITGNPEMLMIAQDNPAFFRVMNEADLVVADGIGLVLAARHFLGASVPERVPGYDIMTNFFPIAAEKGYRIYLLGSAPGIAETARNRLIDQFPGLQIVGTRDGYFTENERPVVLDEIRRAKPDLLVVGMGAPRQELFIAEMKNILRVPVAIGLGGSIDGWAGVVKRAPRIWQDLNLEWLYRVIKQPSRFGRMLVLPKFVYYAARYKERRIHE